MWKNQQRCSIKLSSYSVAIGMNRPMRTVLASITMTRAIHGFRNGNIPFRTYAILSPDFLPVHNRHEPSRSDFSHRDGCCSIDFLALQHRRYIFTVSSKRSTINTVSDQFCNNQHQCHSHQLYQLQQFTHQRMFVSSFKARRARRRKHERMRALMKPEDTPSLLLDENIIYMTSEEQINQWVSDTVLKDEKITKSLSTPTKSIYAGVHAIWLDSETDNTSIEGNDSNVSGSLSNDSPPKLRRRQIVLLQISLPQLPVAVVHFTEIYKDSTSTTGGSLAFPIKLKELLEVPNLVVCSIHVNELCTALYYNYHVSCLIRVEIMDLAKKAISYQQSAEDDDDVNERNFLTQLRRYGSFLITSPKSSCMTKNRLLQSSDVRDIHDMASINSTISKMMDKLCYYFLSVANRPKKLDFERPTTLSTSSMTSEPLTNQKLIRYYASHVYHARLLTLALLDLVDDGEENLFHDDCETVVNFNDPNIPFHPTIDQLPQPLSLNRKVAILMTDDEYHDALIDSKRRENQLNIKLIESDSARHPFTTRHSRKSMLFVKEATDEFKMMKPYSRKILAIGLIEFLGDPHGIMKRFDTTSYLVGRCNDPTIPHYNNYEDEAIVRLQKVKHPNYPITSLNCNDEKYWIDYPLYNCYDDDDENDSNNIETDPQYRWPTIPTLGWVLKNALRPLIIVDQSRLVLFNKDEIIDPNDKPWLPKKREDTLPLIPPDISKYL